MKKQIIFLLSLLISSILNMDNAVASHGTGGELTWKCLGTGEYVFQLKFYRECNGIIGPATVTINTTVPGLPSILAPLVSQTDISPDGFAANGSTQCPTCAQGNPGTPIFGLIEEFVYETAPVTLNGVPPVNGWTFSWGECCRSAALTNIANGGSVGFQFQAKMYSYLGQNADPCFDASPYFAERPNTIICTGLPIVYQHLSADPELDSLVYDFDNPLNDLGDTIPFAPGYSIQDPLGDPVTLDNHTGEYTFTSTTAGYYAMVIKVSSFKCGILVSETRREINVLITNNCPPISGGASNLAPQVPPPFIDSISGLQTFYADTVIVGDTVNFEIDVVDFDLFTNGAPQMVTHTAFGQQYGTNFTDPLAGCLIPPCATLAYPTPWTGAMALVNTFNWTTTPAHLGYSLSCVQFSNTYHFLNKVSDNYCPANASNTRVISITVLPSIPAPAVINNGGILECNLGGTYLYQWFLNRFAIPGATASTYTPLQVGTYQVLAIAPDGQGNYSNGYYFNPLGVSENDLITSFSVQPNPSIDGIFQIEAEFQEDSQLSIYVSDIYGKIILADVWNSSKGNNSFTLDLNNYASGVYIVELRNEQFPVRKMKLIKE